MKSKRDIRLDLLRIVATLMVVFSHVAVYIIERSDFYWGSVWWGSYFFSSISRIATPVFFMLSGYLFSNKKISPESLRKRALTRLMIPYVFFSTVGAIFYNYIEFRVFILDFISKLYLGGSTHLYFLLGLFVLYLLNPYLKAVFNGLSENKRRSSVVALLIFSSIFSLIFYLNGMPEILTNSLVYWLLALGYYLFGMYYEQDFKRVFNRIDFNLGLLIVLVFIVVNFVLSSTLFEGGLIGLEGYLQNYFSVLQIMTSIMFFGLTLKLKFKTIESKKFVKIITFMSDKSYGVYLSHMMILEYLTHKTFINTYDGDISLAIFLILSFFISIGVGLLISTGLSKIKYLRIVIGINDFKNLK